MNKRYLLTFNRENYIAHESLFCDSEERTKVIAAWESNIELVHQAGQTLGINQLPGEAVWEGSASQIATLIDVWFEPLLDEVGGFDEPLTEKDVEEIASGTENRQYAIFRVVEL